MIRRVPTVWETWVQSLGWEGLLEKEMATHSSSLAWKIPWREEPGRLQSLGSQSRTRATSLSLSLSLAVQWLGLCTCIAEGLGSIPVRRIRIPTSCVAQS